MFLKNGSMETHTPITHHLIRYLAILLKSFTTTVTPIIMAATPKMLGRFDVIADSTAVNNAERSVAVAPINSPPLYKI